MFLEVFKPMAPKFYHDKAVILITFHTLGERFVDNTLGTELIAPQS